MDEADVHRTAMEAARSAGYDPDNYEEPEVTRDGDVWRLFFMGRSLRPGDHFEVVIGADGAARVIHGR